ncbi:hypothetical protein BN8_01467 [Fibrisoma limi BUZ 3]|uniref:Uncharacterized protein n=1 Tax=Fibrisoma limi BUZ 3 TaxID=1185876 RepID=I2GEY9_9BACT|nr:hypothetical protein BN8_01467 [Fibrisoma limi BUZ 3]
MSGNGHFASAYFNKTPVLKRTKRFFFVGNLFAQQK